MPTIGVAIITKNEESCIGKCLNSLKGFDDIVVLDTGSDDIEAMKKIIDQYDCRYLTGVYEWADSFAEARNEAIKYIHTDYLLVIDSDEIFQGTVKYIKKAIKKYPEVLAFNVKTVAISNPAAHHLMVRLHKNCKEVFWSGPWHNYLSVQGQQLLENIEVHYGYSKAHDKDPDRGIRIGSKFVKENPKCTREKYYLGREFYYKKDYKMALYYWEYYLENATFGAEIADTYLYMARCQSALGDINKAKDMCLQAIKLNSNFKESWEFLASLSGPGNKKRFNEIAKTASNESVLFARS